MFERLLESDRKAGQRWWSGGVVALLAHAAVISGALWATAQRVESAPTQDTSPVVIWRDDTPDGPTLPSPPRPVGPDLTIPVEIPTGPPTPDFTTTWDPGRPFGGPSDSGNSPYADTGSGDEPIDGLLADEAPELLAAPHLYPPLLQQAGIEGRVVLRVVVDTNGHVEPGSIVVRSSSNPGFTRTAIEIIRRAVFRPGRVHGRPVRVIVELPVDFHLSRTR